MYHRTSDDAVGWIGYTDFLTTLVILFFLMAALAAAPRGPSVLRGSVAFARENLGITGCIVMIGAGAQRQQRTDSSGAFSFQIDGLWRGVDVVVQAKCDRGSVDTVATVLPTDTTNIVLYLVPITPGDFRLISLPDSALFERNEYVLKPEGVATVVDIGRRLRRRLRRGEVVAVQGHTDDIPFRPGAEKENWVLSAERAAEVARVLTDSSFGVGLPDCSVVAMGFGPSRPKAPLTDQDSRETRIIKRRTNRRVEFRVLSGTDLTGLPMGQECR